MCDYAGFPSSITVFIIVLILIIKGHGFCSTKINNVSEYIKTFSH